MTSKNQSSRTLYSRTLAALLLLSAHTAAVATEHGGLDFSLQLSQAELLLHYDDLDHETNVERVGVVVFDAADPHLHYGFLLGSSHLTLDSDPLLAGLSLDGYHAGLALRGRVGDNPRLDLLAQYLYQDVQDTNADRKVTITWHEWRAEALAALRLSPSLTLQGGVAYMHLDPQLRITGDGARTRNMQEETATDTRLGVELNVDNGRLGLQIQHGLFDSVSLIFARTF